MEIAGFVLADSKGHPVGPLFILAIRPRQGASKKLYPTYLAPQTPFDRVALRSLFCSTHRMILVTHPAEEKPRMFIAPISDGVMAKFQKIANDCFKNKTFPSVYDMRTLTSVEVKQYYATMVRNQLDLDWSSAVVESSDVKERDFR